MLSLSFRKYKDVVEVYYTIIVQCIIKNVVNIVLECSWGIIKAKWGYQHLIKPKAGNKCCKPLIALSNIDPVKRNNNIKLSIEFSAAQGIKCFMDKREWVLVFDGDIIKSFVVIADSHPFSWLSGK